MKTHLIATLALVLALMPPPASHAGDVPVAWDPSPTPEVSYVLKRWAFEVEPQTQKRVRQANVLEAIPVAAGTVHTISLPAGEHLLTVQAVAGNGLESETSNELLVVVPDAPGELRIEISVKVGSVTMDLREPKVARTISVESSTDLRRWRPLATVSGNVLGFTLTGAAPMATDRLFWRAR